MKGLLGLLLIIAGAFCIVLLGFILVIIITFFNYMWDILNAILKKRRDEFIEEECGRKYLEEDEK